MEDPEQQHVYYLLRQTSALAPGLASVHLHSLPDELIRRLSVYDPADSDGASTSGRLGVRLFCQERHDAGDSASAGDARGAGRSLMVVNKWRQKEKLKTTAVALVLCLNIGVDPPDVVKISPCARLECWVDPLSMQPAKALETIGKNLQAQYERWQPRAKYKMHLDPTLDDVKKLAGSCRRTAKAERVLFHYNGHGVPRPTVNGEIWVFNSRYTQYIPLSIYELQAWLGTPAIYVLDCSAAGLIINSLKALMDARAGGAAGYGGDAGSSGGGAGGPGAPVDPMREVIVLAACGANELLPQNPDLPADVFTAALTTPIKVALRWFCSRSLLRHDGLTKELIDRIPGRQTDRKTPLGELNWIFTAITDTIAWNSLPRATFQKLFRQDLLVASLFRNFLLAERVLAAANATPVSWPRLPPTHQHPMWQAWDMAAEMCLLQLPGLLSDPSTEFQPSTFFAEQLTAFELWLAHGSADKRPPEQLPIVLQVLLSQVHRLRALVLLGRFLDMGPWAVDLALSVGIFPYVLKLLQTTSSDLRTTLVFIWAKILALDTSCQADLVKDGGHLYFLKYLDAPEPGVDNHSRAQAVFVLATVCDGHPRGQALCFQANLLGSLLRWLQVLLPGLAALEAQQTGGAAGAGAADAPGVARGAVLLVKWCCLALGRLVEDAPEAAAAAMRDGAPELLSSLLGALDPELRASAVFALGCLIHSQPRVGPGATPLAGARYSQPGLSGHSSSSASLAAQSLGLGGHGSSAAINVGGGAAGGGLPPSGSTASLGGADLGGAAMSPAAIEAAIAGEQSIAALLLRANVVYDASALVRSELAVALSRLVRGHMPLLEDAIALLRESVSLQQRKITELLRAYQRTASMPQHASEAPGAAGGDSSGAAAGSSGSSNGSGGGGSSSTAAAATPPRHPQTGQPALAPGAFSASLSSSWPEMGAGSGGAPGGPPAGLYVPEGSAVAAAAAAAGVGAGPGAPTTVYSLLLETVLALATDPSPRVARLGRRVLGLAQMELAPLAGLPAPSVARSASGGQGLGLSPSSSVGGPASAGAGGYPGSAGAVGPGLASASGSGMGASIGSLTSKLVKGGRSWRSGFAAGTVGVGAAGGGSGASSANARSMAGPATSAALSSASSVPASVGGSPPGSPTVRDATAAAAAAAAAQIQAFARQQYVVRAASHDPGACGDGADGSVPRMGSGFGGGGSMDDAASRGSLPSSGVYAAACDSFSRPMLEPQASAWRELEAHKVAPWLGLQDSTRKAQRLREMEAARTRCRGATNPRLREQVSSIETGADSLSALVFHSFHLLLVTADTRGFIRVQNAADGSMLNTFHATNGASLGDASVTPTSLVALRQLNEAESNLLLACASDGAVRVWRSYLHSGNQRLAAAWQAVPMRQPAAPVPWNACYALADAAAAYWLYAAGGSHPDVLQRWDLASEMCAQQIAVRSSSSGSSCPVAIEHLSVSPNDPHLLLAGCSDQMLRRFDVRTSAGPVLAVHAGRSPLASMVLEPCGRAGAALTGSSAGELRFLDLRGASSGAAGLDGGADAPGACLLRSVQAHSAGGMSVLAAHPNAPLLATATAAAASVVKVWTDAGDLVGAIKSAAPQRMAPVTAMAWHPFNLYLGAGGRDSVASVFIVDHV